MFSRLWVPATVVAMTLPAPAFAQDSGVFAGLDVSAGLASGSSSTTDGGAPFAGGGVVENVDFGTTVGIGGHLGYRLNPAFSAFVSYQHSRGDVSWDADFPLIGAASAFEGTAVSNAVMANIGYDVPLSGATSLEFTAGAGLSFNVLSGVVETDKATGIFLSDVAEQTRTSPVARIGAGLRHQVSPGVALGLNLSASYGGGFETGDTRSGNLGITEINPYEIDDIWRVDLGASVRFRF